MTLGSGIIIVPSVAILQSIGIGKSLAERGGYKGTNFIYKIAFFDSWHGYLQRLFTSPERIDKTLIKVI